jgi:anthranilate phosphoribosyltransferase
VHSLVVHGEPGMDEISPMGRTSVIEIRGHVLTRWEIDPASFGFALASASDLAGGAPAENAATVEAVLNGSARTGATTAVLLNAAAAIYVAGRAATLDSALAAARDSVQTGKAAGALDRLRRATR